MKKLKLLSALLLCVAASTIQAEEIKGKAPHGGRMIELGEQQVEFYVTPEKMAEVRFFDKDMKPVKLEGAEVQLVAQAGGSQKYDLVLKDGVFITETALPEGTEYNIVLRIKPDADSGFKNIRFVYNSVICEGCQLAEYACTCEGH